ncbi:MAG TPA: zinc ribbon domain-containing protein [Acidimicrobiales bacterium]
MAGIPPGVTEETAAFWEGAAQGRLVVERCTSCGTRQFPPRGMCRVCRGRSTEPFTITGNGIVYSFTVNHQRWEPDMEVPFALVLVDFPDHPGVRIAGRFRGGDPAIGMAVEIGFEAGPVGFAVPSFAAA